jgi:CheY-like chemotaxis protein
VLCTDSACAGIELARLEEPNLILMDLSLPEMNGWDATRVLKNDPETRAIPVIAVTAHAQTTDVERALRAGCDDYETKPINIARLSGKISILLKE